MAFTIFIDWIPKCRNLCFNREGCEFITYYGGDGFPLKNFCELLKSCDITGECSNCVSETRDCYRCSKNIIGIDKHDFFHVPVPRKNGFKSVPPVSIISLLDMCAYL